MADALRPDLVNEHNLRKESKKVRFDPDEIR